MAVRSDASVWGGLLGAVLALGACGAPVVAADGGTDGGATAVVDAGPGPVDAGPADDGGTPRWANLQWPPWATVDAGAPVTVYGQVWVEGRTEADGAAPGLVVEVGVGPVGVDPGSPAWRWSPASFNVQVGHNDEWRGVVMPVAEGTWDVAVRARLPGAFSGWLLGDRSDRGLHGSDDGWASETAGKVVVPTAGATWPVLTLNLHCLEGDVGARLDAVAARMTALGTRFVALQEVCTDGARDTAAQLATRLGPGWTAHFTPTHLANGSTSEGVGFVTQAPVLETDEVALPLADFARKAVVAVVAAPVGVVAMASTHVSYRPQDAAARADQARTLVGFLDALSPRPAREVVCGDFNAGPTEASLQVMRQAGFADAWAVLNGASPGLTFPSSAPSERIDYAWARGGLSVVSAQREFTAPFRGQEYVSDHCGVSASFRAP